MPRIPSEEEVLGYAEKVSNWGRWGPEDELGTLNLIAPEKRLAAFQSVREGFSVGCARPIMHEGAGAADVLWQPLHFMLRSGENDASTGAADFVGFAFHGLTVSHVDTLAHQFLGEHMYNGREKSTTTTEQGAVACSVETMKDGLITRGVLFDIPRLKNKPYLEAGEAVFPEDLEEAEAAQGVKIGEGDALLLRTGWYKRRLEQGPWHIWGERPGLHAATIPWLHERGVSMVAGDAAQDAVPSGYERFPMPLHNIAMTMMGLCLFDNLQFEDLAPECERRKRWEVLFIAAPLRIRHGTGSPTTPLAVF
ncbi:MAG: cyclase family protein [Chloroflexi bacterium]|nr:cyclase family protein [Chloroflexota bacterium]